MVLQPKFPQNPYKPIPFETPELAKYKDQPVTETEAKKLVKDLGCENVIETSALIQHNLKENLLFFSFGITTLWDWVTLGTHA